MTALILVGFHVSTLRSPRVDELAYMWRAVILAKLQDRPLKVNGGDRLLDRLTSMRTEWDQVSVRPHNVAWREAG
jgi:hypothetical protein